ncbi:MAG: hypothetical protein ABIP93_02865 [Gemmatimonadaceae bacterium]
MAKKARRTDRPSSAPHDDATRERPVATDEAQPNGLWAIAVYLLVTIAYAYPALAGRFLVNQSSDQFIGGFPLREFATMWERAGHGVPLWNPYIFGGMPYVASMNGDIFYPTALLRLALGTDVGMTVGFILHVFLAGCFTYLFLRRAMRLGFFGSLVGGLAYMAGGNVAGLVSPGHDGKLFVAALLPLVLFFLHRGVRDARPWAWGALALTVTLALLSPHPQLFQYLLLASGAYALFIALTAGDGRALARRDAVKRLGLALAAVIVGTLGGAIQYLPLVEYTPWSPRAGGKGWEHAVSYSMPPEELLDTYLPQFSGILQNYSGRNIIHLHSEYLGAAVLVLASLAFGARLVPRSVVRFWTVALVVALLWALGGFTPFYQLVYLLVPGTKFFRAPSTMLFFVSFCTAVLAAIGTERLLARDVPVRRVIAWATFAGVMVLLAATGMLSALATNFAYPPNLDRVTGNERAMTVGAVRALLAVGAVVWLAFDARGGRLPRRVAGFLLAAAVGLDLWSIVQRYWLFSAPAAELYASDDVIRYAQRIPEPARVLPLFAAPLTSARRDPYLGSGYGDGDGLMVHGIRSVFGYHGNETGRYGELTGWTSPQGPMKLLTSENLRRLLNLQYVYTNARLSPIPQGAVVAGPARNSAGNTTYLVRIPGENPMAWVAPLAIKLADTLMMRTLLDARFDVRRIALFDSATTVPTQPVPSTLPESTTVKARVTTLEPGHIVVALDAPAPANAVLVVSENYYPGWRATVDGTPAPVGRADFAIMGVGLRTGARRVELQFRSDTYERGRLVTVLAVVSMFLALVAGIARSLGRSGDEPRSVPAV